jgi:hypothetical protein
VSALNVALNPDTRGLAVNDFFLVPLHRKDKVQDLASHSHGHIHDGAQIVVLEYRVMRRSEGSSLDQYFSVATSTPETGPVPLHFSVRPLQ